MDRISSRLELHLFLYLRYQVHKSCYKDAGDYIVVKRPTLVTLLHALEIDYTHKPAHGRIFFHWRDCTELVDDILAPKHCGTAAQVIGALLPVEVKSQKEYTILNHLFSLRDLEPVYEARDSGAMYLHRLTRIKRKSENS